jgi:hypothetical protein
VRLYVESAAALREVLETLVRLPLEARRAALARVAFTGLGDVGDGQCIVGTALGPRSLGGSEWVIVLQQREGIGLAAAHELAHVLANDDLNASADAEARAVALVNSWGLAGGDPAEHAARFERRQRTVTTRTRVDGDRLGLSCAQCNAPCHVVAPVVPGLPAEIGIGCERCGWFVLRSLASLVPCVKCDRDTATVLWADTASPQHPAATWTCAICGPTTLVLTSEPAPVEPAEVPPELAYARQAARELMNVEKLLLVTNGSTDERHMMARERARVGMVLADQRLRRSAAALGDDPQAGVLRDLADEVALAVSDFLRSDDAAAADRVASITHRLNLMSSGSELRLGGEF